MHALTDVALKKSNNAFAQGENTSGIVVGIQKHGTLTMNIKPKALYDTSRVS